jgi:short-subunit dehydrogenase
MQAVLPVMRQQGAGSIINVSSGITWSTLPGSGAYAASKAGLQKLSAIARAERAGAILALIRSGAEQAPEESGGTVES